MHTENGSCSLYVTREKLLRGCLTAVGARLLSCDSDLITMCFDIDSQIKWLKLELTSNSSILSLNKQESGGNTANRLDCL